MKLLQYFCVFKHLHSLGSCQPQQLHNISSLIGAGKRLLVISHSAAGFTLGDNRVHESQFGHDDTLSAAHRTGSCGIKAEQSVRFPVFFCQQFSDGVEKSQIRSRSRPAGRRDRALINHYNAVLVLSGKYLGDQSTLSGTRHSGHNGHNTLRNVHIYVF